jgi:hypothetical protein
VSGFDNGIDMLEDCVVQKLVSLNDYDLLLCGDMNAKTSDVVPEFVHDDDLYINYNKEAHNEVPRRSEDKILNSYGKKLLNLCSALGLIILNGVCNGDLEGRYTYISDSGNSVNDYFITSANFLDLL